MMITKKMKLTAIIDRLNGGDGTIKVMTTVGYDDNKAIRQEQDYIPSLDELVAFCEKEIETLNAARSIKPTARQTENEGIKNQLVAYLEQADAPKTVTMIIQECGAVSALTNQRVSALLNQLVDAGRVTNTKEKKVSYYSIANGGEQ